ncbi:MAG TPA: hypothetical protein VFT47_21260 [Vicinamibacterales bacterium]|nr:hypothetical protein [Vicinamibacterales bacterium]
MKQKLAVGLLIVAGAVIVLVAVASVVVYFRVYAPVAPLLTLSGATNMEGRLSEKDFVEPASDELIDAQVTKFAAVEREVEHSLGAQFEDVRAAYERLVPSNDADVRRVSTRPALEAFGPVRIPFLGAKTVQVRAMNQASLSKREFEWVRQRLYRAAGLRLRQVDFSDVAGDLRSGALRVTSDELRSAVPERNFALTRPLVQELRRWIPLAFWGL